MMREEFEERIGYKVTPGAYADIIEPMYMMSNLGKDDFCKMMKKILCRDQIEVKPEESEKVIQARAELQKQIDDWTKWMEQEQDVINAFTEVEGDEWDDEDTRKWVSDKKKTVRMLKRWIKNNKIQLRWLS